MEIQAKRIKMRGINRTDIENKMENALKKEGIEFVFQYPIRCKYGYIVDFFIPSKKLIIECDGEAWHDSKKDNIYLLFFLFPQGPPLL